MTFPDSYNPLETMEKLLPIVANSLELNSQEVMQMIACEISPATLRQSSLERMQGLLTRIEQLLTTSYGNVV